MPYKSILEVGDGENRILIEADRYGRWYQTTNAETRGRIQPANISGWAERLYAESTAAWLIELEALFGSREIALGYARRCGAKGVPRR